VHLETFAQCNAACNFCPYPKLERKGERMDDTLIQKVLGDLKDIPPTLNFQLSPFKVSEPFLDKRLFDILQEINAKLPNASITLTTNASPLTEQSLTRLSSIRNLSYLWISFNDHREAEYEATMQLPYKRTIERLDMLHRYRMSGKFPLSVILSRVGDGTQMDMEFTHWANRHYPGFETYIFPRMGWLGEAEVNLTNAPAVPNAPCIRWFELSITATGKVAHCYADGQAKYPIGDVSKQHVLEIYNSPQYRSLRERTVSRKHVEPCNQCNFL